LRLDIFTPKSPPLIGMDISSSAIKMVEIADEGKGKYRIERYAIEPLPKDSVIDGNITNLDAVADCARRAWKRLATRTKHAALALPVAAVITKRIIVPAGLREEELELQVETEANQYIPFALEEVNLDFQVLGPAPSSADEVEVLIAASRKEKVEDRVAVAESAGLKATVMDVESYATLAAFGLIESRPRRQRHRDHGSAQRAVGVHPRAGVRRFAAHDGHPARLRHVAGRSGRRKEKRRPARQLRKRGAAAVHRQLRTRSVARPAVLFHVDPI
jgi:type IV pilus assembly protein PilM